MLKRVMFYVYIASAILFYLLKPYASLLYACLFLVLFVQSYQDITCLEISNYTMMLLCMITVLIAVYEHQDITAMVVGACSVSSVFFALYAITKGKAIGGADVKFMFLCGIFLGYQKSMLCLFYACMAALPYHICIYKGKSELPFLPFLSLGVYLALIST